MLKSIKVLIVLMLSFFIITSFQNKDWRFKVDEDVLSSISDGGQTDFLVIMKDQLEISTKHLHTKKEKGEYVFNQLSVHTEASQRDIQQWLRNNDVPFDAYFIVNLLHIEGDYALVKALAKRADVRSINANPLVPQEFIKGKSTPTNETEKAIPWGITKIKANQVWSLGYQGTGVVIGGQDTGYDWDHPALKDKYRGWDGSTADHNYNWHDAIHAIDAGNSGTNPCGLDSVEPCDDNGHGTHTMGTMVGDDGGSNQIGVAPAARWIGCRNMERGDGTPMTYIECFEWFMAPTDLNDLNPDVSKAPHVINNSWGCPVSEGCNTANFSVMETALNNLKNSGVMVVVSAGNSGSSCGSVNTPAAIYEESFSTGAMSSSDVIANFSSRGPVTVDGSNRMKPNISAPGVGVRSSIPGTGYNNLSGTSMAGPHVAGAVALMINANPNLAGDPSAIEDIIEQTAIPFTTNQGCGTDNSSSVPNNVYGYGAIDALAAVNEALNILPVSWISFEANSKKKSIQLDWRIAQQINIKKYIVERSQDNRSFIEIGQLNAQINPEESILKYHYLDAQPKNDLQYYRIKIIENDGKYSYSKIVTAQIKDNNLYTIAPNPFAETFRIHFTTVQSNVEAKLYAQDGTVIQSIQSNGLVSELKMEQLSHYPKGIYMLVIYKEGEVVHTERVLLIH